MLEDDVLFAERRYGPVDDRIAYARLLREAAETTAGDWVMSEQPERDAIHVRGLLRLIWAAGCRLFAYFDMPEFSPGRAEVLLAGAGKLGIPTSWKGWT
jgi:hypothetical protein